MLRQNVYKSNSNGMKFCRKPKSTLFLLLMFVVAENNICVDKNLMKKKSLSLSLLYRVYFSNINKLYGPLNVLST